MNEETPDNAARATPVARYNVEIAEITSKYHAELVATESPTGQYVRHADHAATVAALEAEVERLRTALGCVAWTRKPGPIPSRVPGSVVEQMERIAINALTGARAK